MNHTPARLVAALALAGAALTACGGGSDGAGPSTGPSSSGGSTSPTASATPTRDASYAKPAVGECRRLTAADVPPAANTDPVVSCAGPHTARTFAVVNVPRGISLEGHPPWLMKLVSRTCAGAWVKAAGGTPAQRGTSVLSWAWFRPTKAEQKHGARRLRCDLVAHGATALVRLPPGTEPVIGASVPPALTVCVTADGKRTACGMTHRFRIAGTFQATGRTFPGKAGLQTQANAHCPGIVSSASWYWFGPSSTEWTGGSRTMQCFTEDAG